MDVWTLLHPTAPTSITAQSCYTWFCHHGTLWFVYPDQAPAVQRIVGQNNRAGPNAAVRRPGGFGIENVFSDILRYWCVGTGTQLGCDAIVEKRNMSLQLPRHISLTLIWNSSDREKMWGTTQKGVWEENRILYVITLDVTDGTWAPTHVSVARYRLFLGAQERRRCLGWFTIKHFQWKFLFQSTAVV